MLTNYDAKAVAEVMGVAFLLDPKPDRSRPAKSSTPSKPLAMAVGVDFRIRVDDIPLLVVEAKTHKAFPQSSQIAGRASRHPGGEPDRVSPPSPALIEKAVERGLPREALRNVAVSLAGGDKARISLLEWNIVPKTTLERRQTQLSPQESERTERVARLFVHARRALGTEAEARDFMTTPHPELDERSPLDAARSDLGARRTEQILNALEYGLAL